MPPKKGKKKGGKKKGGKKKAASSKGSRGRSSSKGSSKKSKSRSKSSKKRKKSRSKTPAVEEETPKEDPLDAQINHGPRSVLDLSYNHIHRRMGETILEIALPYICHWDHLQKIFLYGHGFEDVRKLICAILLSKSNVINISMTSLSSLSGKLLHCCCSSFAAMQ